MTCSECGEPMIVIRDDGDGFRRWACVCGWKQDEIYVDPDPLAEQEDR